MTGSGGRLLRVAVRRTVQEGIHAIDYERFFDDEPRRVHGACRRPGAGGGRGRQFGGRCRHRLSRWRQRHADHLARSAGGREFGRSQGFSADAGSLVAAGRGRGGRETHDRRDRRKTAARGAAGQPARTRQAHRGAEGRARQSAGRDRCGDRPAQIRRAICGYVSGRDRRQGRGAADRRMARGLCRGRRGSRQRRRRHPRCRAQAARTRPRNRASRTGPGAEAAEQDWKSGSSSRLPPRPRRRCG